MIKSVKIGLSRGHQSLGHRKIRLHRRGEIPEGHGRFLSMWSHQSLGLGKTENSVQQQRQRGPAFPLALQSRPVTLDVRRLK